DSLALAKDQYMQANLSAHIMNKGQLRTQFRFDMLSKNGAHSYSGTLGRMNASEFNRILFPLLNVEIASGNIRGIRFNVSGTDYRSRGDFRFDYDNLKISLKAEPRSEEHTSELQSRENLVCRLLLEKKKTTEGWVLRPDF